MKTFLTALVSAALAAGGTWYAMQQGEHPAEGSATGDSRKILFYQSAMHPWVKSDKPGRCTICGMELTPIYEGQNPIDETSGGDTVVLTQSQIQVLHVQTSTVQKRALTRSLRVSGVLEDNLARRRMLSAYTDGRLDKLYVSYVGEEVTKGQPLAKFYSPALLQAEREYRQLSGDLKTKAAIRLIQMGLTEKQMNEIEQKPATELSSEILIPISGTVIAKSVIEGQYVSTGQPMYEVADLSTMWFIFRAYEQDMPWLKTGLTVTLRVLSEPGKTYSGKITFIDPNLDNATRSANVRVELENPLVHGRRELSRGLYADGTVELEAPEVLTVPRSAVIETGPQAVVYVDRGEGAYERVEISAGRRGDMYVEVLAGLREEDPVVTNGNLLMDGQAEMNRAFMAAEEAHHDHDHAEHAEVREEKAAPSDLTPEQKEAIGEFLRLADAMALTLSNDDLEAFNKASEPAMEVTGKMIQALGNQAGDTSRLNRSRHFHGFDNMQAARTAYHAFSVAAVALLEPLRKTGQTPEFQIFECGMVDEAIPGVPRKARWIQTGGRKLLNPFFGSEMLTCGVEIKP